jgi:hypothetical protein
MYVFVRFEEKRKEAQKELEEVKRLRMKAMKVINSNYIL